MNNASINLFQSSVELLKVAVQVGDSVLYNKTSQLLVSLMSTPEPEVPAEGKVEDAAKEEVAEG